MDPFEEARERFEQHWWATRDTAPEDIARQFFVPGTPEYKQLVRQLSELRAGLVELVSDVTRKFTQAWTTGAERPKIEDFLAQNCSATDVAEKRPRLFYELLNREIQLAIRDGEQPQSQGYRVRFREEALQRHVTAAFDRCTQAFSWRFRIVSEVPFAKGGEAEVLFGFDDQVDRRVAIKRVLDTKSAAAEDRLRREARTLALLSDAGVPTVYGIGYDEQKRLCLAEHLILGAIPVASPESHPPAKRFSDVVDEFHKRPGVSAQRRDPQFVELVATFIRASRTVAAAHEHPYRILHRDLSPTNILVDSLNQPFIIDWGLALWLNTKAVRDAGCARTVVDDMTRVSGGGGTPGYLSPEQATMGRESLTPASDVFSLGACLFQLLTGYRVYDCVPSRWLPGRIRLRPVRAGHPRVELVERAKKYRRSPDPRSIAQAIDPELADITQRALDPNPRKRHPSAREFTQALEDWVRDLRPRHHAGKSVGASLRRKKNAFYRGIRHNTGRFLFVAVLVAVIAITSCGIWIANILRRRDEVYRKHLRLTDLVEVLETMPTLLRSTQPDRRLPNKAIERLNELQMSILSSHSALDWFFSSTEFPLILASDRIRVARFCRSFGDFPNSLKILHDGIPEISEIAGVAPLSLRPSLAEIHFILGDIESDLGHYESAIHEYDASYGIWGDLEKSRIGQEDDPAKTRNLLVEQAKVLGYRGDSHVKWAMAGSPNQTKSFNLAETDYTNSLNQRNQVVSSNHSDPEALLELAHGHGNLARLARFRAQAGQPISLWQVLKNDLWAGGIQLQVVSGFGIESISDPGLQLKAGANLAETLREVAETLHLRHRPGAADSAYFLSWTFHRWVHSQKPSVETSLALANVLVGRLEVELSWQHWSDKKTRSLEIQAAEIFETFRIMRIDEQFYKLASDRLKRCQKAIQEARLIELP